MFKFIILLIFGTFTLANADIGYKYYEEVGKSYKFISTPKTWNGAKEFCESQNARMAMPQNQKQHNILNNLFRAEPPVKGIAFPNLFMAAFHDFFHEGSFINLYDSRPIPGFLKWHSGEPNELVIKVNQDCGCFSRDGTIWDYPCERPGVFFCEKSTTNDTQEDDSDGYVFYPDAGMEYKFSSTAMSWNGARTFCQRENARLAMPINKHQLKALTDAFKSYPPSPMATFKALFMAGFHDFFNEGHFINLYDQRPIPNFLEWSTGEPNELALNVKQDCGAFGKNGRMWDYPCERPGVFFCERNPVEKYLLDVRFFEE